MPVTDITAMAQTVRVRFTREVADRWDGPLPVQYDNDGAFVVPEDTRWVRWTIQLGETPRIAFGATKRYRNVGVGIAQIFVPFGKGNKPAMEVAAFIQAAFRSVTEDGVHFESPSVRPLGRVGAEWQVNVTCPFYADEIV
jgi:hypothetical protein